MDRINVRLDPELKAELDSAARLQGVSPSDVVRSALREHLKASRGGMSCLDVARQLGLVGVYTDAPSDLSTNRAHMEGFGE